MRIGVIAATASIWAATMASAQTAPESNEATIRRIIGKVDIAAAALFTANRATLEQTCGEKDKSFHISSGISRFEFAALHKPEREQYVGWMQGQELRQALVTIGLSIIIADQLLARFGGNPFQFWAPDMLFGPVQLPFVGRYPIFRLFQVGLAIAVGVGMWLLLNKTKLGIMVRAGVDDRQMLAACGVNVPLVAALVFALGAGLAGLGGVIGATAQPMALGTDARFLLISLVVVIVGGMGSIGGTALGAILIGLAEQWGQVLFPTYSVILTFVIMAAVLAVRPQGLLGRKPA